MLKELNGGNPWPPSEIAEALGIREDGDDFYQLTTSARDYGLTKGIRDTKQIALNVIGRELVYAASSESQSEATKKAFFNVDLFKAVYEYYRGRPLPDLKYLQNTLRRVFEIPPKYHQEFFTIYSDNFNYLETFGITGSYSIVVGEPNSKTALVAFVVMPFRERTADYPEGFFDEVLRNLITPAAIRAGFKVETARREGSDMIHSTIVNDLLNADLVIADLTEHNPNVLFELGLRMAIEKPVVLVRAKGTSPIFDVDNLLRVLDYGPNLWKTTLEDDVPRLASHIKGGWDNRESTTSYMGLLKKHG